MLKNSWLEHDSPTPVNGRMFAISRGFMFTKTFTYAKFRENLAKFLNLEYQKN